ncbi:putative 1-phosphatidylinositol-3-phosphate 5-kinase FAB1C isoform X2 [Cynara cardunculus var. scolymus]|uniref:putative 1-phosphatidylinositol-3-phosphate 5-kinase FAB1C isoform X2 n=1 Tax=Cynara cardunculus var. scolymus TaxID=59895 RepID=UPI000D62BA6A|nr:putative 1-phosphatidylinositol-3-phosphate 5-kinase FAB1C isoform X2 [Cynara cardunculus var. scolymus]
MGVPDNTLLDLIEKVRSWIYWGRSDLTSMSVEVKMADGVSAMCCQCEMSVSESCLGYHCRRCSRLFCESCVQGYGSFVVVESKSGTQAGLNIRSCKFCADFDVKQKFGGKFSHKIHPSDSPRQSPEPPSPNYVHERFDGSSLQAVSVRRSLSSFSGDCRSDEDEAEDSSKNIFSPYSRDTSDVDSSSVNTRHEFYSFMSVGSSPSDSPSRSHFTSSRRRHSVQLEDQGTPRSLNDGCFDQEPVAVLKSHQHGTEEPDNTTNDDLSIFRDQYETSHKPLDLEKNGLIWFPLPPDDEETSFFSYADDDDDDEMGATSAVFSSSDPLMSLLPENGKNMEHKKPLENVVQGHFRALVSQLLQSEFTAADEWLDIITSLAWQAANYVKPDTSRGGSMDPGDYVKIKCIASGSPNESTFVKGVVCTKNIKHKRMTSQYKNPRLLILGGALEYQRSHNQLASIEALLQQEMDHLKTIVSRIEARRPNVLLVEKSVSSYAQEYLLAKEISLVSNVKRSLLERIARCTGTPITPSVDKISTTRLGQCELFRLEKFSEVHEAANLSTKKPSKTLMFFDGCPRRLGCTVLLKGSCREELKKVKHVVQYAVFAAYHLSLETSFLADEGASLPKTTVKPNIAVPERSNADNAISAISSSTVLSPSEVANSPRFEGHDLVVDHQNSDLMTDGGVHTVSDPLDGGGALECSRLNVEEIISIESTELEKVERLEVIDGSNEYYSATDNNQSILVSFSSRCVLNGTVCERSRLLRIKFYGCFDKPLGRYLQDDLFDQASLCRSCNEAAEAHVICYTHQQGNLTINVRRLPSLKLPGEKDGKIWMWHRCLRCAHVDGVPPATHRVVMSEAAWGLSFGKFLELSFSNHATANRIAGCGHSLQRDCLRFYGLGSMVVFFRYSPIDILSVRLPPSVLQFSGHAQQDWLKKDVSELLSKTEGLYDEILDVLHRTEQKSISDGDGILDSGELSKHVKELKEMLIKERNVYTDLLQPCGEESVEDHRDEIDVFELNRLRHSLMIGLHVWDRRVSSLNSIYNSKPTYDAGSKVEVKHRRCFSTFEHTVDHGRAADDSEPNQIEETDGSPRDFEESESISSDQFEEGHISAASFLSDKIDSAWAGPLRVASHNSPTDGHESSLSRQRNQSHNPHFRRLTSTPARVYSFDSAITLQERFTKELPFLTLRSFQDPNCNIHRSYSQNFPSEDPKSEFLRGTKPLFISATSFLPEGARLMLPYGGQNAVIAVYDNEPTSIISYALASKEYEEWFADKPHLNRNHSVASKLSAWQSFGSVDLDYMQYGNYGSEDPSTAVSLFTDAKSSHHLTIPFEDESGPGGKVKFSVTCYFAKQFDALRKKCCPSEVDYMRSLSRCKRWSAQGGKSNVYFAKSLDERFIIKQVTKTELESFEEFAPQYFKYLTDSLNSGSPTCLAKIVGIYQVTVKHLKGGKEAKMHVMVMENLFYKRNICRVYDLKGSARSRYNSDMTGTNKTLLDMNLLEALRTKPIFLGSKAKRSLERAVWNDTSFLASIDVMDYSLLVGVDEESKELVLGIIDFMRQYTWDKQLETWVKASGILGGPKNASPTIISPKQYKRRFRKAMTSYFLTVPDQWSS